MGSSGTAIFDGPTLWAAAITLTFAVLVGIGLSSMPQTGHLGGAVDALKNVAYVLTLPLFDLSRRFFAARRGACVTEAAPAAQGPDLLRIGFLTALLLFVLVQLISVLTNVSAWTLCQTLAENEVAFLDIEACVVSGLVVMGNIVIAYLMLALGATAGWIWKDMLQSGFLNAFLIFVLFAAILFALDFLSALYLNRISEQALLDRITEAGVARHVGTHVALLSTGLLLGYGAKRLWQALTRAFG